MRTTKATLMTLCVVLLMAGFCYAEPIDFNLSKMDLPDAKPGVIVSIKNEGIEAVLTTTVIEHESKYATINIDVGAAPAINVPLAGVTIKLGDLSQYGFKFPLRKYFDIAIGGYVGFEINEYQNDPDRDWKKAIDYGVLFQIGKIEF